MQIEKTKQKMHIQTSNSKVSAAEKNQKCIWQQKERATMKQKKQNNNAVYVRGHESTKSIDANIAINREQLKSE